MNYRNVQKKITQYSFRKCLVLLVILLIIQTIPIEICVVDNVSGTTIWTQSTENEFKNGNLTNIEIIGNGTEAVLRIKRIETKFTNWTNKYPSKHPSPRGEYGMASIWGTHKIVLFGGCKGWPYLNDTWIYDLGTNNWLNMKPKNSPPRLVDLEMATIHGTDKVILFGGLQYIPPNPINDTWIYDLSDNNWTKMNPLGSIPPPRRAYSIAPIWEDDKIVIFGGWGVSGGFGVQLNDTWVYDYSDNKWVKKNTTNSPSGRSTEMSTISGEDKVILFGGARRDSSGDTYYNDTWIYDLSENNWTQMNPLKSPSRRAGFGMTTIFGTDKIIIFGGGIYFKSYLRDTWIYNFTNNTWSQETPKNYPIGRTDCALASIFGTDKVMLFSGYKKQNEICFNETWVYGIYKYLNNGTYISPCFEIPINSSFKTINWNGCTPAGTNIEFQLKTAITKSNLNSTSFKGPDGLVNTFYNSSGKTIWVEDEDEKWIQYKINFSTSNSSISPVIINTNVLYNYWPNEPLLLYPENNTWINYPQFIWAFKDCDSNLQGGFQWQANKSIEFDNTNHDSMEISSNNSSYFHNKTLSEGNWYWRVRTKDSEGDWGPFSEPWLFKVDTIPPKSSILSLNNNSYHHYLNEISGIAFDPNKGSGLNKVEIAIKRIQDGYYWNGSTWNQNESWLLTSGTSKWSYDSNYIKWTSKTKYLVQSRAYDNASNIEIPNITLIIIIDQENPISIINNPINNTYLKSLDLISGSASDFKCSGIRYVEINIHNIKEGTYWDGINWIASEKWLNTSGTSSWIFDSSLVLWISNTSYIIKSRAIDNCSNVERPSFGKFIQIDKEGPFSTITSPKNDSYLNDLANISGIALDFGGSEIDYIELCIKQLSNNHYWDGVLWNSKECWLTVNGKHSWYYNSSKVQWTTDNRYIIYSRAIDKIGIVEQPSAGINFMYDDKPPDISIIINNDDEYTNSTAVLLSLQSKDTGSGISRMAISTDNSNWIVTIREAFNTIKLFDLSSGDGEKSIFYIASDNANNTAESVFDSIILDSTPPTNLSLVINDEAKYTNSSSVKLKLSAEDFLSGIYQMAFSIDNKTWSSWEAFDTYKTFNISTHNNNDGKKNIYYKVSDRASNVANVFDTIILDTKPPHSLTIIINNGMLRTNSTKVILQLSAIDDLSGIALMSFSLNGYSWGEWLSYIDELPFILLTGDGEKTVFFRVNDKAGNIADPIFAKILLNTSDSSILPEIDFDGDKYPDDKDMFPNDPNEWIDNDNDGIGNNADQDDDNDGIPDNYELIIGSNPLLNDTDGDSFNDAEDAYPLDSNKWEKELLENKEKSSDLTWLWVSITVIIIIVILLIFLFFKKLKKNFDKLGDKNRLQDQIINKNNNDGSSLNNQIRAENASRGMGTSHRRHAGRGL